MVGIKYPTSVNSNEDRYAYLYRLEELLRLEHNKKGKEFREKKITENQWVGYKNNVFNPKSQLISDEVCKYRKLAGFIQFFNAPSEELHQRKQKAKKNTKSIAKLSDIVI